MNKKNNEFTKPKPITFVIGDDKGRTTIPKDLRKLMNLNIDDFIQINYITPKNIILEDEKTSYDSLYSYQQIKTDYRFTTPAYIRKLLDLKEGTHYNAFISKEEKEI